MKIGYFLTWKLEALSSLSDIRSHPGITFDNYLTMSFAFFTSGSMHAKRLLCTVCLPNLVLVAQVVFLLECEHTQIHTHTQMINLYLYGSVTASAGK